MYKSSAYSLVKTAIRPLSLIDSLIPSSHWGKLESIMYVKHGHYLDTIFVNRPCAFIDDEWVVMIDECLQKATVYHKKCAHGFCFAVLCCGYTLTDFPISIRLTSLALWQSNDCPSASKATLKNMDKYFMWIHYERLHNHNKAKHNKTVCIFLGIYCSQLKIQWHLTPPHNPFEFYSYKK